MAIGIRSRIVIPFYPKTDGQIQRVNKIIEASLHAFANLEMNTSVKLVPMAGFAFDTTHTPAIGPLPFYTNYADHVNSSTSQPQIDIHPLASKAYRRIHDDC
jgi:hypothetical protein